MTRLHSRNTRFTSRDCLFSARNRWIHAGLLALCIGAAACSGEAPAVGGENMATTREAALTDTVYAREAVSVVRQGNYLWVFALGSSANLARRVYDLNAGQWIADWEMMDAYTAGQPSAVVYTDGANQSLSVYKRGLDNHLWELYWVDATNPSNPFGWFDVSAHFPQISQIKGYVTATSAGDQLSVFVEDAVSELEEVVMWSHSTGYVDPDQVPIGLGVPEFRTAAVGNAVAVRRQGDGGYLQIYDRQFFSEEIDSNWHAHFGELGIVGNGVPAMQLTRGSLGSAVQMFANINGTIKTNAVFSDHSQFGWTSYGTCSTSGNPAVGRQNAVSTGTPFPYYPHLSPFPAIFPSLVAADTSGTCRNLGGAMASAPVVVSVPPTVSGQNYVDYVFYKGVNGHVWMYTSARGHQDLGLALAPLEAPVVG